MVFLRMDGSMDGRLRQPVLTHEASPGLLRRAGVQRHCCQTANPFGEVTRTMLSLRIRFFSNVTSNCFM